MASWSVVTNWAPSCDTTNNIPEVNPSPRASVMDWIVVFPRNSCDEFLKHPQHLRKCDGIKGWSLKWFSSVKSLSCVWLFATQWITECWASLSITNSRSLLKLMSIESVMPSNHLILCRPLLLPPSVFSSIRVFSTESALHISPKYWSFNLSISPSNEHPALISFRMYWLDLLAVQGTLKSLLQHHSSKVSILWC